MRNKSSSQKTEIPMMFCFDNNYSIPASVAFYSLLEHANKDYNYKLFVLHSDITKSNQKKLKDTIKVFSDFSSIEFIDMTNRFADLWDDIKIKGHFSKEVMYKVLVASIFPQYEKIIVSDVDVVFLGDISDSYLSFNIEDDFYLAGVKMVGKIMHYMDNYKTKFTDEEINELSSFCGGYIVFNLHKLRQDNMEDKFINCFIDNSERLNQMEQDVLNLCCYPKIKFLPLSYVACSYMWDLYLTKEDFENDLNYKERDLKNAMNSPIQLHYATSIKPWKNVDCTKSDEWFKYIVKTMFLADYLSKLPQNIVIPKNRIDEYTYRYNIFDAINELIPVKRILCSIKNDPLIFFRKRFYVKLANKIKNIIDNNDIDLVIFDNSFPSRSSSFRYQEYKTYLKHFKKSIAVLLPDINENQNQNQDQDQNTINSFIKSNNLLRDRVSCCYKSNNAKLAIMTFLNITYDNLQLLKENKIPFVFTLYPGGGFALNDSESDKKLKEIMTSDLFRKVITTQQITYDYLINNNFCSADKIKLIYGGIITNEFKKNSIKKMHFGINKNNLDICFSAHKYSKRGVDKGYDRFIEVAKVIAKRHKNIKFHVIGEFSDKDINVESLRGRIKFYGVRDTKWFKDFYSDKDIIISPNRPYILSKGSFDGFPVTCSLEAMLNRVALICTDELNLNRVFKNDIDIVIVDNSVKSIVDKIEYYYNNPEELKKLSNNGMKSVNKYYSFRRQLLPRIRLIKDEIKKSRKGIISE